MQGLMWCRIRGCDLTCNTLKRHESLIGCDVCKATCNAVQLLLTTAGLRVVSSLQLKQHWRSLLD